EVASKYVDDAKGVSSDVEALAGARDILAELINEDAEARAKIRQLFLEKGQFVSKVIEGKEEAGQKYKDYFNWTDSVKDAPSHRILAMRRGEKELILTLDIMPPEEEALVLLDRQFVKSNSE